MSACFACGSGPVLGGVVLEPVLARVKEWLESGRIDASLEDTPWVVEESEGRLVAYNPLFINPVVVEYDSKNSVLRLRVDTGVKAILLGVDERLRVYHRLLLFNRDPLIKGFLEEPDDSIVLSADLTSQALDEREFNTALALLMIATLSLYKTLREVSEEASRALQEEMAEALLRLPELVRRLHERGWSRDELVRLLSRALSSEEAVEIVDGSLKPREEKKEEKEGLDTLYQ